MILAFLSSLSLTTMVILDRILIKDCYADDSKQALFLSTSASMTFGLVATFAYWLASDIQLEVIYSTLFAWLSTYGILIFIAGFLSAQVTYHYFTCFSMNGDSTVVASWLAATPIFVYLGGFLLYLTSFLYEPLPFNPKMLLAVLITSLSLVFLEKMSNTGKQEISSYKKHLVFMLIVNTAYLLLIDQTFAHASTINNLDIKIFILAMLPIYWIGFGSILPILTSSSDRAALMKNHTLKSYIIAIVIVEIFGMLVFFFEFLGLGTLDSVTVSIIVGLHVIPVWAISVILTKVGKDMSSKGLNEKTVIGIPLSRTTLEEFSVKSNDVPLQLLLVLTTVLGISLFVLST